MKPQRAKADVLGISVDALNMSTALTRLLAMLEAGERGYVCMVGAHGVVEALSSAELRSAYASAAIMVPDGMPTAWLGRLQGNSHMRRVAGPELMLALFEDLRFCRYTHFFFGGEPGVAEELRCRFIRYFPWARVVGTYTPPFRELNNEEQLQLLAQVHVLKPDIIWVGISTPKQERFMAQYTTKLDTTLMLGVGAAFDFHTGRIADAPTWVKEIGMQWFHRLLQDPKRLWRRYLRTNTIFLWRFGLQLVRTGLSSGQRGDLRKPLQPQLPILTKQRF